MTLQEAIGELFKAFRCCVLYCQANLVHTIYYNRQSRVNLPLKQRCSARHECLRVGTCIVCGLGVCVSSVGRTQQAGEVFSKLPHALPHPGLGSVRSVLQCASSIAHTLPCYWALQYVAPVYAPESKGEALLRQQSGFESGAQTA